MVLKLLACSSTPSAIDDALEEGREGYDVDGSGRRCGSTVFIAVVSGLMTRASTCRAK